MGRDTDPPIGPVRNIAEYERMSGVLIRYPFGVSLDIIRELSEDIIIYCLVSSSSQNAASNSMIGGNVNMENVELLLVLLIVTGQEIMVLGGLWMEIGI